LSGPDFKHGNSFVKDLSRVKNPNIFFFFLRSFDTVIQIGSQKEFASLMLCRITFHYAIPFLISAHTPEHAVHAAEYAVKAVFSGAERRGTRLAVSSSAFTHPAA